MDSEEKKMKGLKWTKIDDVWGIGRRYAERLKRIKVLMPGNLHSYLTNMSYLR